MDKQRLNDFLWSDKDIDMREFVQEVEKDAALREGLRELERMSLEINPRPDRARIWRKMSVRIRHQRQIVRQRWMSVAAILVVGIVSVGLWGIFWDSENKGHIMATNQENRERVQLLLADGQTVEIANITTDTLIQEAGADIKVSTQNGANYATGQKVEKLVYNTLRVPRGNEYHIVLSENTEVWLNSESELRFPVNFVGNERRVFLRGEAFFAVARDTARPFRVVADEMEVEVLGTQFNVNAYRDNGNLLATLVEGSVRVTDTLSGNACVLSPGQQAEIGKGELTISQVNTGEVTAWREGRFLFRDMPLERIMKELERWFDVEVLFADHALRAHPFTGVVKRYNTIEEVCALIEETTDVKFVIQDQVVTVLRRE